MKTHYDVLNLHRTCTTKEIKDSFIKLSKLYHPDKNKSTDAHKKFVEVNEAYSVLGKPETRSQYDNNLMLIRKGAPFASGATVVTRPSYEKYVFMHRENLRRSTEGPGHFPTRKLQAFFFCCLIMMIGSGFHMKAILNRKRQQDRELARYLKESRERKRKRTEEMMKGIESIVKNSDVRN